MILMATLTHEAQTCAFGDPERMKVAARALAGARVALAAEQATLIGGWVDVIGHRTWLAVEASGPGILERLLIETGLAYQNSCQIVTVRGLDELATMMAGR